MPYSKDILELKRHLLRAAESSSSYFDLNKLIVDVRKITDSEIPYSGLGARSPNDYFPSIKIIGSQLRTKKEKEILPPPPPTIILILHSH